MTHAGEALFKILEERHISPYDLAVVIGVSESYIYDILHDNLKITPIFAVKLEEALHIKPDFWFSPLANLNNTQAVQESLFIA